MPALEALSLSSPHLPGKVVEWDCMLLLLPLQGNVCTPWSPTSTQSPAWPWTPTVYSCCQEVSWDLPGFSGARAGAFPIWAWAPRESVGNPESGELVRELSEQGLGWEPQWQDAS